MAIIMIVSVWVCPLTVYFSFIPDIGSVCRRHEPSKGKQELTKLRMQRLKVFPSGCPRWGNVRKAEKGGAASGEEKVSPVG